MKFATYQHDDIQKAYQLIKQDKINEFIDLLDNTPQLKNFSNKNGENFLFYAFKKNAFSIIEHLIETMPHLLFKNNKDNHNIFSFLIKLNKTDSLNYFFHILSADQLTHFFEISGNSEQTLTMKAIKYLSKENWEIFSQHCSRFWENKEVEKTDYLGRNLAHLIAMYDREHCLNLLGLLPDDIHTHGDNEIGSTPLLLAARYTHPYLFRAFMRLGDQNQTNLLGDSLSHVATFNSNIRILDEIIQQQGNVTSKNLHGCTPLLNAILQQNIEHVKLLLPFYTSHDLSEELVELAKNYQSMEPLLIQLFQDTAFIEKFKGFDNQENIIQFFSSIFYHSSEQFIESTFDSPLWNYLAELKSNVLGRHALYNAVIGNRKSMSKKINLLLTKTDFLHVEESDTYYEPSINQHKLVFNLKEAVEEKSQQMFCLVASLGTLPAGQIKDILNNTSVLEHFNTSDLMLLLSIGIRKSSLSIIEKVQPYLNVMTDIAEQTNLHWSVQNNLSYFKKNIDRLMPYYTFIINKFKASPTYLLDRLSFNLVSEHATSHHIEEFLTLFGGNNTVKRDLLNHIVEQLFLNREPEKTLVAQLKTKPNLLFYILKKSFLDKTDYIKNNALTQFTLTHEEFSRTSKNWSLISQLSHSENPEKYHLISTLLDKVKIENQYDFSNFKTSLNTHAFDKFTWQLIIEKYDNSAYIQPIINQYVNQHSLGDLYSDLNELQSIMKKLEPQFMNIKIWMHNILSHPLAKEDTIVFFENFFLEKNSYADLLKIAVSCEKFTYIEHLLKQTHISLQDVEKETTDFWSGSTLNHSFEINLFNHDFLPLTNYLQFLNAHMADFTISYINEVTENFLNWLGENSSNNTTKINVAKLFFSSIQNRIMDLDDHILANVCNFVLKQENNSPNVLSSIHINSVIEIIFKNKDSDFFNELLKNKDLSSNNILSKENQKTLAYYYLNESLKEKNHSTAGKKLKI